MGFLLTISDCPSASVPATTCHFSWAGQSVVWNKTSHVNKPNIHLHCQADCHNLFSNYLFTRCSQIPHIL